MQDVYMLLGSNLGDRKSYLATAEKYIKEQIGELVNKSCYYQTASWGRTDQPDFINQVLLIQTTLTAQQVLEKALKIETKIGRVRNEKWGSRIIDIDILFYGMSIISEADLVVPHPHLHERAFVLVPLVEIAPEFIHPVLKKTVLELCNNLTDSSFIERINC